MDHKEQHHEKHRKAREQVKKERKEHEHQVEKGMLPFHPAWLFGVGLVLTLLAVGIWSVLF